MISAIIPTVGRPELLGLCLESLARQTVKVSEAIVVHCGDDKETFEVANDAPMLPTPVGIVFAKGSTQLRDAFQAALKEIIANGTYRIVARHSGKVVDVQGTATTDGRRVVYQLKNPRSNHWPTTSDLSFFPICRLRFSPALPSTRRCIAPMSRP